MVFIDELPLDEEFISGQIRVNRNIYRAAHIPVFLSGTNYRVNNLVGKNDSKLSGSTGQYPWVKIITSVPRANFKTFGCSLGDNDETESFRLADFIENNGVVKFDDLLFKLIGFSTSRYTNEEDEKNALYIHC